MVIKFNDFINEGQRDLELHYFCFDWDDNLLHMPTVIHMDKKEGDNWVPVDVSTSEFAIVRNDKEGYRLRNDDPTIAFSEFRDTGHRGDEAFLIDVKKALDENRFAPSWDAFIKCLSEGSIFAIITARGHESDSIRKGVEYIIDNVLDENQKFLLYSHCLKNAYIFTNNNADSYDRIPKGKLSETPLVKVYLDNCDYCGVSSKGFAEEFGQASASNPEHAKELALNKFVEKCNKFGHKIGAKSVSVGFSDDDVKNVEHVQKYFKEKSALTYATGLLMKYNVYNTTDRTVKGGLRSKYRDGELVESRGWGLDSSVVPFSKWTSNQTDVADVHNYTSKNKVGLSKEVYKKFAYKKSRKKK